MAASGFGGFKFGSTATSSASGGTTTGFSFGAKTTAPTISFGSQPIASTTGFSFGNNTQPGATSTAPTGFSFGGAAKTTASTGFSFGGGTTTTSAGFGGGLFGKTTSALTGFSLTSASTSSAAPTFQLGGTLGSKPIGFGLNTTVAASSTDNKPENVKDQTVPAELNSLADNIEKHIKKQKEVKDEITKISSEQISTTRDELKTIYQNVALIGNAIQRNSIAVENLKSAVNQELKNGEICHRLNQVAGNFQQDFTAPIEYFQRLVYTFESRISNYRQELEELEAFLTSASPINDFSPQDLSTIMRRLSESFVSLASELYQIHEQIKNMKEKYLHYRRVVYGDGSDPFAPRKKKISTSVTKEILGPSPFPVVQGAGIMAAAFKTEPKSTIGTTLTKPMGFGSTSFSLSKPAGLTRSFSFDGSSKNKSTSFGGLNSSGSLFNKPTLSATPSLNAGGTFALQNPPTGKRGRIF